MTVMPTISLSSGERNVAAVVFGMDDRLDAIAAGFGRRVYMRDPGDGRSGAEIGRRDGSHDDAVLILFCIGDAHRTQLIAKHSAQFELAGRTWIRRRLFIGFGIDADVSAKTIEKTVHEERS
jgi:hypothetical protein